MTDFLHNISVRYPQLPELARRAKKEGRGANAPAKGMEDRLKKKAQLLQELS